MDPEEQSYNLRCFIYEMMSMGQPRNDILDMPLWEAHEMIEYLNKRNARASGKTVYGHMSESQKQKIRNYKEKFGNG